MLLKFLKNPSFLQNRRKIRNFLLISANFFSNFFIVSSRFFETLPKFFQNFTEIIFSIFLKLARFFFEILSKIPLTLEKKKTVTYTIRN